MSADELRKFMAERAMGWRFDEEYQCWVYDYEQDHGDGYVETLSELACQADDWKPDEKIDQAMICLLNVSRNRSHEFNVSQEMIAFGEFDRDPRDMISTVKRHDGTAQSLAAAICEVVRAVLSERERINAERR